MIGDFNNNIRIDALIIKFLDRQTTAEEEKELQAWVAQSEENKQYFTEIQYLWNTVAVKDKTTFNSEAAFQRFKARISVQQTVKKDSRRLNLYSFLRWVAVFLIAFLLGGIGFYFLNNHLILRDNKLYSISVPDGAKVKLKLPDKSLVWLNSGSILRYNQNFGIDSRQVSLTGEGYFEIAKNPDLPFVVHTKQASIKVLGTEFDVDAYPDDDRVDVTLLKGAIQLKTIYQNNILTLKPNQKAIIDKKNKKVSVIDFTASKSVEWTKEKFFPDNESFMDIIQSIERRYNIKIVVKNPRLNKLRFYGDFQHNRSVNDILKTLADNDGIHYKIKNNEIVIY